MEDSWRGVAQILIAAANPIVVWFTVIEARIRLKIEQYLKRIEDTVPYRLYRHHSCNPPLPLEEFLDQIV